MKKSNRFGWLALCLLAVIVSFVIQIGVSMVVMLPYVIPKLADLYSQGIDDMASIEDAVWQATSECMGLTLVLAHIAMLICFSIWYYYGCGRPKLKEAKGVFAPTNLLVIVLVALGMCFFVNFALPVATLIIPKSIVENYEMLMEKAGFGVDMLAIIASILIAPIGEEFICRGVVFHYAKRMVSDLQDRRKAFWIANTVQALMFGILHANIIQGSYAFVMGLALGYLRHRYNSLLPAIFAHMLINSVSSFAFEPLANLLPESDVVYAICALVFLGITFAGFYIGGPAEKKQSEYSSRVL